MLAAGAHGWHARLEAVSADRDEGGAPRWLVNHEVNQSGEAPEIAEGRLGDERPCLGDVGSMVWRVET